MFKIMKNLVDSFVMAWDNLCLTNKIIMFFLIFIPNLLEGISYLIRDMIWLIDKI